MGSKSKVINVRVSVELYGDIEVKAKEMGIRVSEYVREVLGGSVTQSVIQGGDVTQNVTQNDKTVGMDVRSGTVGDVSGWLGERVVEERDVMGLLADAMVSGKEDEELEYGELNKAGRKALKERYYRLVERGAGLGEFEELAVEYGLLDKDVAVGGGVEKDDGSRAKETKEAYEEAVKDREDGEVLDKARQTEWRYKRGKKRKKV